MGIEVIILGNWVNLRNFLKFIQTMLCMNAKREYYFRNFVEIDETVLKRDNVTQHKKIHGWRVWNSNV